MLEIKIKARNREKNGFMQPKKKKPNINNNKENQVF